jgi:hypothetical protein
MGVKKRLANSSVKQAKEPAQPLIEVRKAGRPEAKSTPLRP